MAKSGDIHISGQLISMTATDIGTAGTFTTTPVTQISGMSYMAVQAALTMGLGGTSCSVYVQTSLDGGVTWIDIASFAFATTTATKVSAVNTQTALAANITPTDGTLTPNTIVNGLLGDRLRVKYVVVGTYTGATIDVDILAKG